MTANQISFAKIAEDKRHNSAVEELQAAQNKINKAANKATKEHYERQDQYTSEHYNMSDRASMVSANANAMNAGTNQSKYLMEHDIEYGWTGDSGYPSGMPLSAQRKNAELAIMTDKYPYELSNLEAQTAQLEARAASDQAKAEADKAKADEAKSKVALNVMQVLFGKKSLYDIVDTLVSSNG